MFSVNISFIVAPDVESFFIDYFKKEILPSLLKSPSIEGCAEIKKLLEAGGQPLPPDQGVTYAVSADFLSLDEVRNWQENFVEPAIYQLNSEFGENVLPFVSLMEKITLS